MSDPQHQNAAPAAAQPTPVYVVWPGESYSQVWSFLWIGVAFALSGLLAWGPGPKLESGGIGPHNPAEPMGLARVVVFMCAAGMIIHNLASIWGRTLTRGASTANLMGGLVVLVELVVVEFWEHLGNLLSMLGNMFGTQAERAMFEAAYLERGPGYYLALFGVVYWLLMLVSGIAKGSKSLKEKEKARAEAAAAERAARKAASTEAKKS
jgi:hypothetical protein